MIVREAVEKLMALPNPDEELLVYDIDSGYELVITAIEDDDGPVIKVGPEVAS